jgi:putative endopeptidase
MEKTPMPARPTNLASLLVVLCATVGSTPAATAAELASGVDRRGMDASVRIADDFFRHVNGTWLRETAIPADKPAWGSIYELRERALAQLRGIVEAAANKQGKIPGSEAQQIGDLFASFMDEARIEAQGIKPLANDLNRIASLRTKSELPALIAYFNRIGVVAPYDLGVQQDARDSTKYAVSLEQSGLGLPDRDYYLKQDDSRLRDILEQYQTHITKMLTLAGIDDAAERAKRIVALETLLAKNQWTKVENRDPVKTYNKVDLTKLDKLTEGYDWNTYLAAAGVVGKADYVVVSQPSYFNDLAGVLESTPLATWQDYLSWHLLSGYAHLLNKALVDEDFAFNGSVLSGIPQQETRWKRGVRVVEHAVGEGLGKLYVAQYFPPEYKARMEQLVGNLLAAYRQSIDTLDWMSPDTRAAAKAKLAAFTAKIGYPSRWRDYAALRIVKDDLVGNVRRANEFEYQRNLNKLGLPIDRTEWGMTPQTVNAYYNPSLNEIVFPAAILQPPFFNMAADDAVNYGAIGAVIGHEISHGFDDQGAKYDGAGNLRDWWSKEDHEKFKAKTARLVEQYGAYSPVEGYHLNGELTLGENIADNAGLAIAHKAYRLSLAGKSAPTIDGLTGDQRFYLGFGQAWRVKMREQESVRRVKTDPHSPAQFRANGTIVNQADFYSAFGVGKGDKMYLPPEQRVTIW